jgi:hypothetical protein
MVKGRVRGRGKVMVKGRVRAMGTVMVTVTVKVRVKLTNKDKFMTSTLRETLMKTLEEIEATSLRSDDHILSIFLAKNVFIRTVTHHYTGKALCIKDGFLMLKDCAWIADDGRFSTALSKGVFEEVEPFPDGLVFISLGSILDVSEWMHELPRKQK